MYFIKTLCSIYLKYNSISAGTIINSNAENACEQDGVDGSKNI